MKEKISLFVQIVAQTARNIMSKENFNDLEQFESLGYTLTTKKGAIHIPNAETENRAIQILSELKKGVIRACLWFASRPCGSVAKWSECSHGMREVLDSSPSRDVCFPPVTFGGSAWVGARVASSKGSLKDCLVGSGMVLSRFGGKSN